MKRKVSHRIILVAIMGLIALTIAHCSTVAAPSIRYSIDEMQYFEGQSGNTYAATVSGSLTSCAITPDLPAGLTLNAANCAISGTPSVASAQKSYTVVAQFTGTAPHSGASAATQIKLGAMSMTATRVYGQADFTSAVGAVSSTGLSSNIVRGVTTDSAGVYIADTLASRVLFYPHGQTEATRVYGQNGSFTTSGFGASSTQLATPYGAATYNGDLYLADTGNARALKFSGSDTTASAVYGQPNMTTNTTGCTAGKMNNPQGVFVNENGIYVADSVNHRVLFFAHGATTATRVYGQANFISCFANRGGAVGADTLNQPYSVWADGSGVYISDSLNHRVLFYSGTATTASRVYGQPNFTTAVSGTSSIKLNVPTAIATTKAGLFVADSFNNRVLFFAGIDTTASGVIGQEGSYTTTTLATTARNFSNNLGSLVVGDGGLYVAERRRVLYFP